MNEKNSWFGTGIVTVLLACALATGNASGAAATGFAAVRAEWNRPAKPFRVIGNIYYVGTDELGAWLIRTNRGLILLDAALEESAPQIERNIQRMGFRVADVRILLNSHAHFDHSGGLARLKRDSGADLVSSEGDRVSLETGTYLGKESVTALDSPPVHVDRIVNDGETITLGDVTMTAHITPGHTRGCTTWTMAVVERGVPHTVIFYCSTTVALNRLVPEPQYPGIVDDYRRSFGQLAQLSADVFLANHKDFFQLWEKRVRMKRGTANPFVDAGELQRFVAQSREEFERDLSTQAASAGQPDP